MTFEKSRGYSVRYKIQEPAMFAQLPALPHIPETMFKNCAENEFVVPNARSKVRALIHRPGLFLRIRRYKMRKMSQA